MLHVSLTEGPDGPRLAYLREPCGHDEMSCRGIKPRAASQLLSRLLIDSEGKPIPSEDLRALSLAERDRLIAELYRSYFGDTICSAARCQQCGKSFDVDFELRGMVDAVWKEAEDARQGFAGPTDGQARLSDSLALNSILLDNGVQLRAPNIEDEQALERARAEDPVELLLQRCVLRGHDVLTSEEQRARVTSALEAVSPILDTELAVQCAHCDAEQFVSFDIVSFFLSAFVRERGILMREVHCLARAYGWSRSEILDMPRDERQAYVSLVIGQAQAEGALA